MLNMTKEKRLEYTAAAEEIAGQMTLEEKIALMSGDSSLQQITDLKRAGFHFNFAPMPAGGNSRLNVPALLFCDGPRGVVCGYGKATCFPVPVMRGAAFDPELEEQIGHAIGREVRASGGNFFGGVCINLPYHPGWGRCQEVYGEDSFAMGTLGAALVRGVQDEYVIACLKHYAFNSMEDNRFHVSISCEPEAEREVFLPHFKDCIDAGAAAVMTAFNQYRGVLCGHSEYLIRQVLKNEWDFDGFVISDFFWGISDTVKAADAGMDIEMCHTRYYGKQLVKAVRHGLVKEACIDEAAVRIIRTLIAFEREYAKSGRVCTEEVLGCQEHAELALRAASEGITLIKNDNNTLPLSKRTGKIAVIGHLAIIENTGDTGSSQVYPDHVVTILDGIINAAPDSQIIYYDGSDLNHMKRLARDVDAVIFAVGLDYRDEGEYDPIKETTLYNKAKGGDRKNLGLHPQEVEMLNTAGTVNPVSIAVLMGGSSITLTEWEKSIPAILYAYYPGQEGGTAVGHAVFGDINPSGKLPFVLPASENDLPDICWDADKWHYGNYHGYRYLEKMGTKPFRPYGFGMSYTTFEVTKACFKIAADGLTDGITASVRVKNTGSVPGTEVIQLYVGFSNSKRDRPVKTLCGFQRVTLKPQKSKKVTIFCPLDKLKYYDPADQSFKLEHMEYEVYIGTSSQAEDLLRGSIMI